MVRVNDPEHKKIFSILSHGTKQRIEIVKILEQYDDMGEKKVDNLLNQCLKYYKDDIIKKNEGGNVYYERTDANQLSEEVVRPKKYANRKKVDELLECLEERLNLGAVKGGPTEPGDPPIDILQELLELAQYCKYILKPKDTMERYMNIFQHYSDRVIETYTKSNEGSVRLNQSTDPVIEYKLLFELSRILVANSKKGQESPQIGPALHNKISGIDEKFSDLPKTLCLEYQRLAREIDYGQGTKFFESLVLEGGLNKRELKREAFYTFDIHHESDILIKSLSELSDEVAEEQSQKIRELANDIANHYVDHPVNPGERGPEQDR